MNEAMKTILLAAHNQSGLHQIATDALISAQRAVSDAVNVVQNHFEMNKDQPTAYDLTGRDLGDPLALIKAADVLLEQAYIALNAEQDTADIIRFYEKRYNELTTDTKGGV